MNDLRVMNNSLFSPDLFEHYYKVAHMLSKSGITPFAYKNKPDDIFIALEMGFQLGLPVIQSIQDIAVINGKPCIYGDGLIALVLSHPECEDIRENVVLNDQGDLMGFVCTAKRKGHEPYTVEFTIEHAKKAGLWKKSGPWTTYPERMLQMRARSWALRDKFADALRGIKTVEEVTDFEMTEHKPNEYVDDNAVKKLSHTQKLKQTIAEQEAAYVEIEYATEAQLEEISLLIQEKDFPKERVFAALKHYKAESLLALSMENANKFIAVLQKE